MTFTSTNLTISNTKLYHHHAATEICERAKAISQELGIIEAHLYQGHTTMTNYLYVNAPIKKMVNVLVTYDVFYFLDDFFGEDTHTGKLPCLDKLLKIWKGKETYPLNENRIDKLYKSIEYVSQSIRKDSPASFFDRYTNSIIEHLNFSLSKKNYSSVEEYIQIRLKTGGMYAVISLIEYVHSIYLTEEIRNNPLLHLEKLQEQCALIGALSNDLFSYAKEKHSDYNLINAYLITEEAHDYGDAVTQSIELVNEIYADFRVTMEKAKLALTTLGRDEEISVQKYFEALDVIVASSYHWQKITDRYYHPDNVFDDMKAES